MSNTQNPNTNLSSEDEKCYTEYQNKFQNPIPTYVEELGVCLENFYVGNGSINPTMCVDNYNTKLANINMLNNSSLATSLNNLKNCIYTNNTKPPTLKPTTPTESTDYSWIGWLVLAIIVICGIAGFVWWKIKNPKSVEKQDRLPPKRGEGVPPLVNPQNVKAVGPLYGNWERVGKNKWVEKIGVE